MANCHKLVIFKCAAHDGSKYCIDTNCMTVLHTNMLFSKSGEDPFREYTPDPEYPSEGHDLPYTPTGDLLNNTPYCWTINSELVCGWTGNPTDGPTDEPNPFWWAPTEADRTRMYEITADALGSNMVRANHRHTLIVLLKFHKLPSMESTADSSIKLQKCWVTDQIPPSL